MITSNIKRIPVLKAFMISVFLFCCGLIQAQDFTESETDSVKMYNYLIPGTDDGKKDIVHVRHFYCNRG